MSGKEKPGSSVGSGSNNKKETIPQSHPTQTQSTFGSCDVAKRCVSIDQDAVDVDSDDDVKTKNLAKYLGMKDGVLGSISSQVTV